MIRKTKKVYHVLKGISRKRHTRRRRRRSQSNCPDVSRIVKHNNYMDTKYGSVAKAIIKRKLKINYKTKSKKYKQKKTIIKESPLKYSF